MFLTNAVNCFSLVCGHVQSIQKGKHYHRELIVLVVCMSVCLVEQLYQMYGRRTPEDVFDIMSKYSVSYIILEDSHCLAPSRNGCRLPDLIDIDNKIVCLYLSYCFFKIVI